MIFRWRFRVKARMIDKISWFYSYRFTLVLYVIIVYLIFDNNKELVRTAWSRTHTSTNSEMYTLKILSPCMASTRNKLLPNIYLCSNAFYEFRKVVFTSMILDLISHTTFPFSVDSYSSLETAKPYTCMTKAKSGDTISQTSSYI